MWTARSLKEAAKLDVTRSYWGVVVMSLIMGLLVGGGSGGSGGSGSSQSMREAMDGAGSIDPRAIITILVVVLSIVAVAMIVGLALSIFLLHPLSIGGYRYFVEATYETRTVADIKCLGMAFSNGRYGNIVKTMFLRGLYQWLWSLLFIIPGIVKGYEYRMIPYILAENPEVTASEAFMLSKEMMDGEKWNAFVLDLSFIGWIILSVFTCGLLAVFYVSPYMHMTQAHLYEALKNKASIDYFDHTLGGGFGEVTNDYAGTSPYDSFQDNTFESQDNTFGFQDNAFGAQDDPFNGSIE